MNTMKRKNAELSKNLLIKAFYTILIIALTIPNQVTLAGITTRQAESAGLLKQESMYEKRQEVTQGVEELSDSSGAKQLTTYKTPQFIGPDLSISPAFSSPEKAAARSKEAKVSPLVFVENKGQYDNRVKFMVSNSDSPVQVTESGFWVTLYEKTEANGKDAEQENKSKSLSEREQQKEKASKRKGVHLRYSFDGANPNPEIEGFNPVATNFSYFIGNDPQKWQTHVPAWTGIRYKEIYPGVDLEINGENGSWTWQLIVKDDLKFKNNNGKPKENNSIRLKVEGGQSVQFSDKGYLAQTDAGGFLLPQIYVRLEKDHSQHSLPEPVMVDNAIQLLSPSRLDALPSAQVSTLAEGSSTTSTLPAGGYAVVRSAVIGGETFYDVSKATVVDNEGNLYIAVETKGSEYPSQSGSFPIPTDEDNEDSNVAVTKFSPDLSSPLLYSIVIGGEGQDSMGSSAFAGEYQNTIISGKAISVNSSGEITIAGYTDSTGFPIMPNPGAFQTTKGEGIDGFIVKINADGDNLLHSTYLKDPNDSYANEYIYSFEVNQNGEYVVLGCDLGRGYNTSFTFLTIFDSNLSNHGDWIQLEKIGAAPNANSNAEFFGKYVSWAKIAISSDNSIYIVGNIVHNPNDPNIVFDFDIFVAKLTASGDQLLYFSMDERAELQEAYDFKLASDNSLIIVGYSVKSVGPNQCHPDKNVLVLRVYADGVIHENTFSISDPLGCRSDSLNYNTNEIGRGVAINDQGDIFLTGFAENTGTNDCTYLTTPDAIIQDINFWEDSYDFGFITVLSPDGNVLYSSYLPFNEDGANDIVLNNQGEIYVTGGLGFPIGQSQRNSFYNFPGGIYTEEYGSDIAVLKLAASANDESAYNNESSQYGNNPKNGSGDRRDCCLAGDTKLIQPFFGDPINTITGGFDYSYVDLSVDTIAGSLSFQRSYSSMVLDQFTGAPLGYGWTHNQDIYLIEEADKMWFKAPSGNRYLFLKNPDGTFTAYPGVNATLTLEGTQYKLVDLKKNSIYLFDQATKKITRWQDALGRGFDYIYVNDRLDRVSETVSGYFLKLNYETAQPYRLESVDLKTNQSSTPLASAQFNYASGEDLRFVTGTSSGQWEYVYSNHRLTEIHDPRPALVLSNIYDGNTNRVFQQRDGEGNLIAEADYQNGVTKVKTYENGPQSQYKYDGRNTNTEQIDVFGKPILQSFDPNFQVQSTTDQLMHSTQMTWDGFNLSSYQDAEGNITNLTYDSVNNVTSITGPAKPTDTGVVNKTEYDYVGTKISHVYEYLSARKLTTTYQYTDTANDPNEPPDLLKSIEDPEGRLTQYEYYSTGQIWKVTQSGLVTEYTYDALGRVQSVTSPNHQVSWSCYNPLGKVTRSVSSPTAPVGNPCDGTFQRRNEDQVTDYEYDAAGNMTVETSPTGLVTRTYYDNNNRVIYVVRNLQNWSKANSNPPDLKWRNETDNITSQTVYDLAGNVAATVNPDGTVTRTYYDIANRPYRVTQNLWKADILPDDPDRVEKLVALSAPPAADPAYPDRNITTQTIYDAVGNVIATVPLTPGCSITTTGGKVYASSACVVSRTYYDKNNRPVTVVNHLVDPERDGGADAEITWETPPDRSASSPDKNVRTDTVYDSAGNVIATIDPAGIITRTYYDSLNRPEYQVQNLVGQPVEEPLPPHLYANNQAVLTADNYATVNITTQTVYDNAGQVIASILYDRDPMDLTKHCVVTPDQPGRPATFNEDNDLCIVTRYYYDSANRPEVTIQNLFLWSIQDPAVPTFVAPDHNVPGSTPVYDTKGRTVATVDPFNHATRTFFDDWGRVSFSVRNLTSQAVTVDTPPTEPIYNPANPDQNVPTAKTVYDRFGRSVGSIDPSSHHVITRTYFDPLGRTEYQVWNLKNWDIQMDEPPAVNLRNQVENITTQTVYDGMGRVIATASSIPDTSDCSLTRAVDPGTGAVTITASDHCVVTRTYYDELGRVSTVVQNLVGQAITDPLPPERGTAPDQNIRTDTRYDSFGRAIATIDPTGTRTRTYYDALGRQTDVVQNLATDWDIYNNALPGEALRTNVVNLTSHVEYDLAGNAVQKTDPMGIKTRFGFDASGRLIRVIENDQGTPTVSEDMNVLTEYAYDLRGNRLSITAHRVFKENGAYTTQLAVTRFAYDTLNRETATCDPLGNKTTYGYDLAGRQALLLSAKDAPNDLQCVNPDNLAEPGLPLTRRSYDALGRLTGIDYPDDLDNPDDPTIDVTFAYNELGQRVSMVNGLGTTTWTYTKAGQVHTIQDPFNKTVEYGYNAQGNRKTLIYPDEKTVTYTYDPLNRLKQVIDWQSQLTEYTYDPAGRMKIIQRPNGVNSTYDYDPLGRLTDITHDQGADRLAGYHYTYDANGNRDQAVEDLRQPGTGSGWTPPAQFEVQQRDFQSVALAWPDSTLNETGYTLERSTDNGGHWQTIAQLSANTLRYVDDGLARHTNYWYRLTATDGQGGTQVSITQTPEAVVYGPVDHSTETTALRHTVINYDYDPLGRLTEANYASGPYFHYTYDSNGNRLSEETQAGTIASVYDAANRLTSMGGVTYSWDANGNLFSDGLRGYEYDAANRLKSVTQGSSTTTYSYNGLGDRLKENSTQFVLDLNAGLTQVLQDGTNTYLYGNGRIAQMTVVSGATNSAYFLGDALGSVRQLADGNGAVTLTKNYEPYGDVLDRTGSDISPYGYTGEWASSSTNLLYLRARFYDFQDGRFLTRDAWQGDYSQPLTLNKWSYAHNNPVNLTDPSGLDPITEIAKKLSEQIKKCYDKGDLNCVWWGYWAIASGGSAIAPHASNHLFNFLYSRGDIKYEPTSYYAKSSKWVENSSAVKDFIPKIEQETLVIVHSKARTGVFKGSAKSTPIGVRAKDNEFDLYYAMNAFNLWSEVDYELDCDKVKIKPNFHFQDDYDWHVQWAAGGPNAGAAGLRDEWTQALADAGKAKTYVITGYWTGKEKQYLFPSNWLSSPILPPALQVIEIK